MKTKSHTDSPVVCKKLDSDFYARDVLYVAPGLIGKVLSVKMSDKSVRRHIITEVEAYRGSADKACHASRGRTNRTEIMYHSGGRVYVYFVYGMYWMLNVVAGREGEPQAALIRGVGGISGPGRLTRELGIDGSFYGEDLTVSDRIWIGDEGLDPDYTTGPRVGIDYAGKPWKDKPWRFLMR